MVRTPSGAAALPTKLSAYKQGRLYARPHSGPHPAHAEEYPVGEHHLDVPGGAVSFYVPQSVAASAHPLPLVVVLHGAGARADQGVSILRHLADELRFFILSPNSVKSTWDLISSRSRDVGPDVSVLDQALANVFSHANVDPTKIVISGFSDGASYALSLGLANGDLFHSIVAWSPGFMAPPASVGKPFIYVSHGTQDRVLPVDVCSRKLVARLRSSGYKVRYDEFDGPHTIPHDISRAGIITALSVQL